MGNENDILPTRHSYTVQQASVQTGLSVHTLRYYERVGLLDPPERGETSGHRQYVETDIRRMVFLKCLRTTGMSIRDMRRYVDMYREGGATLAERTKMLQQQRGHVAAQIAELQGCLVAIEYKLVSYCTLGEKELGAISGGELFVNKGECTK